MSIGIIGQAPLVPTWRACCKRVSQQRSIAAADSLAGRRRTGPVDRSGDHKEAAS